MGDRVSAFTLRADLSSWLAANLDVPVFDEQPDALTPPAVVVEWLSTAPAEHNGMVDHVLAATVIPFTDLTAATGPATHYINRDLITAQLIEAVRQWSTPSNAASGTWDAGTEERDLGGQTIRVAVVNVNVTESLC